MCLLALSCSMNHLFVLPSGGVGLRYTGPTPTFVAPVLTSRGGVVTLIQVDRRSGFHRNPDARHFPPRPLGALGAQGRLCDPASTVVQPRHGVDDGGDLGLPSLPNTATSSQESAACRVRHRRPSARVRRLLVPECAGARQPTQFSLLREHVRSRQLQWVEQPARRSALTGGELSRREQAE